MTSDSSTAEPDPNTIEGQAASSGRIGPNAIIRLAEAIDTLHGNECTQAVFQTAQLSKHLERPPSQMVDEVDVMALYRIGREHLGPATFATVARLAGHLTGDYVLTHRIPPIARAILPWLPAAIASRLLTRAISAHAWTFAGSGIFSYRTIAGGLLLSIDNSPLARGQSSSVPMCDFYTATFERIFQMLINRRTRVTESACAAVDAQTCRFNVQFRGGDPIR